MEWVHRGGIPLYRLAREGGGRRRLVMQAQTGWQLAQIDGASVMGTLHIHDNTGRIAALHSADLVVLGTTTATARYRVQVIITFRQYVITHGGPCLFVSAPKCRDIVLRAYLRMPLVARACIHPCRKLMGGAGDPKCSKNHYRPKNTVQFWMLHRNDGRRYPKA
jgi:hypothetical protein